jgi:hypothetical protein
MSTNTRHETSHEAFLYSFLVVGEREINKEKKKKKKKKARAR